VAKDPRTVTNALRCAALVELASPDPFAASESPVYVAKSSIMCTAQPVAANKTNS